MAISVLACAEVIVARRSAFSVLLQYCSECFGALGVQHWHLEGEPPRKVSLKTHSSLYRLPLIHELSPPKFA